MIASKLILFYCFCLLLLDNSIGNIKKSPLERGKYLKLFEEAFQYGKTYGGELKELGSQWDNLVDDIDQANRKVGFGIGELAKFDEAAREVGLAQKDVDLYQELYRKTPVREIKEKLDAAKEHHALKVEYLAATRSYAISVDKNYIKKLEDQKDHVAIEMIVRIEKIKEKFKRINVRKKVKEAKDNGLTDSDIKELLFADYFRPTGKPSIGAGASTADALLSSFRAGMEFILDGTYFAKLRIIKYGNEGGDDGSPEGDDGAPGGPIGDGDDDAVAPGDPLGDGDDDAVAPGGPLGDGDDDGEDYGGGIDVAPVGPLSGGQYDGDIDIFEEIERRYPGAQGHTAEDIETWLFTHQSGGGEEGKEEYETTIESPIEKPSGGEEVEYETTIESPLGKSSGGPLTFSDEELNRATRLVDEHLKRTRVRIQDIDDKLNSLEEERWLGYYSYPSLQMTPNQNHTERVELYTRRAAHIQSFLDTIESIRQDHDGLKYQYRQDFKLTRENFEYYAVALGADPELLQHLLRVPGRSGDIPEFDDVKPEDEDTRYLLSRTRLTRLINVGLLIDDLNHELQQERYILQNELDYLQSEIEYQKTRAAAEEDDTR